MPKDQKQPRLKTLINENGVTCYIRGEECHASYYIGDGVLLEKTFFGLSMENIKKLNFTDLMKEENT